MGAFLGIIMLVIGGVILFLIIAGAVKMAVKEALSEFKEDIMKELNSKRENEENKKWELEKNS